MSCKKIGNTPKLTKKLIRGVGESLSGESMVR